MRVLSKGMLKMGQCRGVDSVQMNTAFYARNEEDTILKGSMGNLERTLSERIHHVTLAGYGETTSQSQNPAIDCARERFEMRRRQLLHIDHYLRKGRQLIVESQILSYLDSTGSIHSMRLLVQSTQASKVL